ncbi:MAG: hypothetical protein RIF33_03615 [Cyclobacteriaceae bacterium]
MSNSNDENDPLEKALKAVSQIDNDAPFEHMERGLSFMQLALDECRLGWRSVKDKLSH